MATTKSKNLSTSVLKRQMGEERYQQFIDEYNENRRHAAGTMAISQQDRDMLADWKKMLTMSEISQKYKVSHARVRSAINRAARAS